MDRAMFLSCDVEMDSGSGEIEKNVSRKFNFKIFFFGGTCIPFFQKAQISTSSQHRSLKAWYVQWWADHKPMWEFDKRQLTVLTVHECRGLIREIRCKVYRRGDGW